MENQDIREQILSQIPDLEQKFWSYYNDAFNEMNNVVWTYIHPNIRSYDPLAFACRSKSTTGVYEIYVNPNVPYEAQEPLKLHEFGHVIFTHMSLLESQRSILIQKIMTYWNRFEEHIDDAALKTKDDIKRASEIICNTILNVAMDYEVNSKLFTDEEWHVFKDYTQWAYICAKATAPNTTQKELEEVLEWLGEEPEKRNLMFTPCWPEDSGFPKGLDYRQYIDLMLMKPDNAMDALKQLLSKGLGDSDDESSSNGGGSTSSNNGKISKEDLERLLREQSDANNDASNSEKDKAEKQDNDEKGTTSCSRNDVNNFGWSPTGKSKDNRIYDLKDCKSLKKKILKEVINKSILINRQDSLYYYNRQKYNSNLMISKSRSEDIYRPGNVYLLVDCSGSIGGDTISTLIGVVKDITKKCGPKSRIIWWDTCLEGDYSLKNFKGPDGCGGTMISGGIKYVNEKYLKKSNDKLIIISDYQDSLHLWFDELNKIKNDCIGICWGCFNDVKSTDEFIKNACTTYSDNTDNFYRKFSKKLPTTLVKVSSYE